MNLFSMFSEPMPAPVVIIRNVLGEEIDRVDSVYDLMNADLRNRQWPHADLSGVSLDGAICEGINLFGARLVRTSFSRVNLRNAELSFSDATSANFLIFRMRSWKTALCIVAKRPKRTSMEPCFQNEVISPA
jgi:hypothetical protein